MFNGIGYIYAQEFTDCVRQTFSLVDCPKSSTSDEESYNDNDDSKNIEEQIPSVIPFP